MLGYICTKVNCSKFEEYWRVGVVVNTTAQLHITKLELRFCSSSNPARLGTCRRFVMVRNSGSSFRWK